MDLARSGIPNVYHASEHNRSFYLPCGGNPTRKATISCLCELGASHAIAETSNAYMEIPRYSLPLAGNEPKRKARTPLDVKPKMLEPQLLHLIRSNPTDDPLCNPAAF